MCGSAQKVRNIRGSNASTCICSHTPIKCDPHAIAGRRLRATPDHIADIAVLLGLTIHSESNSTQRHVAHYDRSNRPDWGRA